MKVAKTPRRSPRPAILFDLDDTLIDSVYQHVLAWPEALERAGITAGNRARDFCQRRKAVAALAPGSVREPGGPSAAIAWGRRITRPPDSGESEVRSRPAA